MKTFIPLSFLFCLSTLCHVAFASHNYQDGNFLHRQLREIESRGDPQDQDFVARGNVINSLANQAKHPKDYEYANFSQSVNALGRDSDPDFYDRAQQINKLASEAKHRK